jgi:hypothetical protein
MNARVATETKSRTEKSRLRRDRNSTAPAKPTGKAASKVTKATKIRPASTVLPAWLQLLLYVQRGSIAATILLTIAVFGVYSWTVYAQGAWNAQYRKLEQLKRYERQVTAAEETLGHNLAVNAQKSPGNNLVRQKPEQTIFLEASPSRIKSPQPVTNPEIEDSAAPLGY